MYVGPEALPKFFLGDPDAMAGAQKTNGRAPKAARRQQRQETEV